MEWSYRSSRISDIKNWPNSDDAPRVLIVGFIVTIRYFSEKIKFEGIYLISFTCESYNFS